MSLNSNFSENKERFEHICTLPFETFEVGSNGDVYCCCPNWNNFYSIGNIFSDNYEEIWNSERVKELRKKILNKDYSLCDKNSCPYCKRQLFPLSKRTLKKSFWKKDHPSFQIHMKKSPVSVKLGYDSECNIACKMCRDKIICLSDEELELFNSRIDSLLIPLLNDVQVLEVNVKGDPFASRHSRLLAEKVAKKYKHIKFDFQTNGILCTENMLKQLKISLDRIYAIRVSIHAATAETYSKIVQNGEKFFPVILENFKFLSLAREKHSFMFFLHFVVSAVNYKEIPDFIRMAEHFGARPFFWELRQVQYNYTALDNDFIVEPDHPLHEDLKKVLRNPLCMKYKDNFTPRLYSLMFD